MATAVIGSGFEASTPATSLVATVSSTTSGGLGNGAYKYQITFVGPFGESLPCTLVTSASTASATSTITLTAIPVSAEKTVTGRNVYRSAAGTSVLTFAALIADNTTTSYVDTATDGSIAAGAAVPLVNTCTAAQKVLGFVKFNQPVALQVASITAGTTQTQAGATATGMNQFISCTTGNANDGAILPLINSNIIGMAIWINNLSATLALKVYPGVAQTINGGGANASVTHAAAIGRWYVASTATNWVQV